MRKAALILLVLAPLMGGATCERRPTLPKVVEVEVVKVVPVPEELSVDCDRVPKREDSYAEAIRLANARGASLEECSARMKRIRELKR